MSKYIRPGTQARSRWRRRTAIVNPILALVRQPIGKVPGGFRSPRLGTTRSCTPPRTAERSSSTRRISAAAGCVERPISGTSRSPAGSSSNDQANTRDSSSTSSRHARRTWSASQVVCSKSVSTRIVRHRQVTLIDLFRLLFGELLSRRRAPRGSGREDRCETACTRSCRGSRITISTLVFCSLAASQLSTPGLSPAVFTNNTQRHSRTSTVNIVIQPDISHVDGAARNPKTTAYCESDVPHRLLRAIPDPARV